MNRYTKIVLVAVVGLLTLVGVAACGSGVAPGTQKISVPSSTASSSTELVAAWFESCGQGMFNDIESTFDSLAADPTNADLVNQAVAQEDGWNGCAAQIPDQQLEADVTAALHEYSNGFGAMQSEDYDTAANWITQGNADIQKATAYINTLGG